MLRQELIKSLKKNNISKDSNKTKERIREVWSSIKRPVREEILALADMKKVSVERAYKTGGASAKVVVAIAQVVNIDPRYLTGEVNAKGTFDDDIVVKYLKGLDYDIGKYDIVKSRKSEAPVVAVKEKAASPAATVTKSVSRARHGHLDNMSEDDVILQIKSLIVQAAYSDEKKARLSEIKAMLLK